MKKNIQLILLFFVGSFLLFLGFQNCSGSVAKFGAASSLVPVGSSINQGTGTPTPEIFNDIATSPESKIQFYSIQNGQPSDDLYLGENVNGIVSNVGSEEAWGCATYFDRQSDCADKTKWAHLPVPGWRYIAETRSWIMNEKLDDLFVADRKFVMFFEDRKNNIEITGVGTMRARKVDANSCYWSAFVIGPSNPKIPTIACSLSNAWTTAANDTGMQWTCACPGVPNPYDVPSEMGVIASISTYMKAYSYYDILTGNSTRSPPPIGGECVVGRSDEGRLSDCESEWKGEIPNKYIMCSTFVISCVLPK